MIGSLIDGRYHLLGVIGSGGMGSVYEAEHTGTGRRVAVKLIDLAGRSDNRVAIDRFHREAKAAGGIDTQHITQVFDVGTDLAMGVPYMAMEFLVGLDLRQLGEKFGILEPDMALRIVAQACIGLQKAHEAHVVHRDIKPANIFLAKRDLGEYVVKLLDFGIAKILGDPIDVGDGPPQLTKTGSLLGTPHYMSPEQLRGIKSVDHRTDIWSLGVVLYQLLTGRTPYQDVDAFGELMISICCEDPPPVQQFAPWISPAMAEIVHRALQRSPVARFDSARAMLDAIQALLPNGWTITNDMLVPMSEKAKQGSTPEVTDQSANTFATGSDGSVSERQKPTDRDNSSAGVRPATREELTATIYTTHDNSRSLSSSQVRVASMPDITTSSQIGRIERVGKGETILLRSQLLVGRSAACDLRVNEPRVSSEHARIRWTGTNWEVRDLGSKNGTFVGGRRLSSGDRTTLLVGDTIGLGGAGAPAPVFVLIDGSAPIVSARAERSNAVRFASGGMLTLPDDEHPEISVVEGREGTWIVEAGETVRDATDGDRFVLGDEAWVLDVPGVATSTLAAETLVLTLESIGLRFVEGTGEQDITLDVVCPDKEIRVFPEKHHSLLLVLARERIRSTAQPSTDRGWVDRGDLCRLLAIDDRQLNVDICSARKEFAALGILGAASVIERRPGTRLLRLGVERVEITRAT